MTPKPRAIAVLLILGLAACASGTHDERQSLLDVHEAGKLAHVEANVAALLENAADEFIAVSNGTIYRQTKADVEAFFTSYLNRVPQSNDLLWRAVIAKGHSRVRLSLS